MLLSYVRMDMVASIITRGSTVCRVLHSMLTSSFRLKANDSNQLHVPDGVRAVHGECTQ